MTDAEQLAQRIVEEGWYKKGDFLLSSGVRSDYYIDLRPCMLSAAHIHRLTTCLTQALTQRVGLESGDLLCGVITSGLFLAGAMIQRLSMVAVSLGAIYVRTEHRGHGAKQDIEGIYKPGQKVIVLDDVATSGRSLAKVIDRLQAAGLWVKAALVVVDREQGACYLLQSMGVPLHSVLTKNDLEVEAALL